MQSPGVTSVSPISTCLANKPKVAALMKSMNHLLVLDSEDDYSQKTNAFTGVPEVMRQFMDRLAGAADIPATRLYGISPAGMNSTGESDMRNYYDSLKAKQEKTLRPLLERLYDILSMSVLGRLIDDLVIEFNALYQQNQKDQAQTELFRAQRDQIYISSGVVTEAQALDRLRANDTYVVTDEDMEAVEELAEQQKELPGATAENGYQPGGNGPAFALEQGGAPGSSQATSAQTGAAFESGRAALQATLA